MNDKLPERAEIRLKQTQIKRMIAALYKAEKKRTKYNEEYMALIVILGMVDEGGEVNIVRWKEEM